MQNKWATSIAVQRLMKKPSQGKFSYFHQMQNCTPLSYDFISRLGNVVLLMENKKHNQTKELMQYLSVPEQGTAELCSAVTARNLLPNTSNFPKANNHHTTKNKIK